MTDIVPPHSIPAEQSALALLSYCADTGKFRWRVSKGSRAPAGSLAGYTNPIGYVLIRVNGRGLFAHRLAWFFVHGRLPACAIDHINGKRDDNRIANLREATPAENAQNQRAAMSSNRSCGLLGVTYDKARGRWNARIKADGGRKFLGSFDSANDAYAAYLEAKAQMHPFSTIHGVAA